MAYLRHPKEGMPSAGAAPIVGRMSASDVEHLDVLVLGAGPAGVVAAVRAARLGARTALVTRDALGGIAAHDGPVPVRTLAHAARLIREARQLPRYGITAGEPGAGLPAAAGARPRGRPARSAALAAARGAPDSRASRFTSTPAPPVHRRRT